MDTQSELDGVESLSLIRLQVASDPDNPPHETIKGPQEQQDYGADVPPQASASNEHPSSFGSQTRGLSAGSRRGWRHCRGRAAKGDHAVEYPALCRFAQVQSIWDRFRGEPRRRGVSGLRARRRMFQSLSCSLQAPAKSPSARSVPARLFMMVSVSGCSPPGAPAADVKNLLL